MDLVLRNACIVDGSGAPSTRGDIAVADGRIVAVGVVEGEGREEWDVAGATVSPGFIDCHTHYDAQAFWDPLLSPSSFHGVTTVLGGNCGFTLAPLSGEKSGSDYLLRMLSRVEGMPLASLQTAVKPTWTNFGGFLDALDGKLAINSAFLVGHSALRVAVMGDRAVGHKATEEEIDRMCTLLAQSLAEGGVGFSTTISTTHLDFEGQPVPSRWASREEMVKLAAVVRDFEGTWLEMVLGAAHFTEEEKSLLTDLSLAGNRPINWNFLIIDSQDESSFQSMLEAGDYARERGAVVYALVQPIPMKLVLNFITGSVLESIPGWAEIVRLPHAEKLRALADPTVRQTLREGVDKLTLSFMINLFQDWGQILIESVERPENKKWQGKFLADYAKAMSKDPLDALFDLAIEEDLKIAFSPPVTGTDERAWQMRTQAWVDERCLVGASDAGAHVDMVDTFAFSTQLLSEARTRNMPLEQTIHLITGLPASRFGLANRGLIQPGMAADLVVFNPDQIDCGPISMRTDLPANEPRLYADAVGIHAVIVNGVTIVKNGKETGKLGGTLLRSGRDTQTVNLNTLLQ